MTLLIVVGLVLACACAYLLKRVQEGRTENAALRGQVASLKRQLAKRRG